MKRSETLGRVPAHNFLVPEGRPKQARTTCATIILHHVTHLLLLAISLRLRDEEPL
ncbi:MAG: hypothetical protein WBQ95_08160 [Terracidiphilus sp.]